MITSPHTSAIPYQDLTYAILQVAFAVHNELGPGFSEDIYEQAMATEFQARGVPFERQKVITVPYKGQPIGTFRLDLVVYGKIIVELKAVHQVQDIFRMQVVSYLKATGMQVGLLINFGNRRVEHKRIVNTLKQIYPCHPENPFHP